MNKEQTLVNDFHIGLIMYTCAVVAIVAVSVIMAIYGVKIFKNGGLDNHVKKVVFICFFCLVIVGLIFLSIKLSLYIKDFDAVKEREFCVFTGEVIGYTYIKEGNSPQDPILGRPIFQNQKNGEKIVLSVGPTELNKIYTVMYLENTKLAVIIE